MATKFHTQNTVTLCSAWADAAAAISGMGLGTMSTQNANAVAITGGTIDDVTANGFTIETGDIDGCPIGDVNPDIGIFTSLKVNDNSASISLRDAANDHYVKLKIGTDVGADRVITINFGSDSDKSLTLSGTATISQDYSTAGSPQFTGVNVGHASDTTITRASAGVIAVEGSNVLMASNISVTVAAYYATGTWTPTLTGTANVGATTAYACNYQRIAGGVVFSGLMDIDPTAANTTTKVRFSLPIASNFGSSLQACGAGTASQGANIPMEPLLMIGDATNDEIELQYTPSIATNHTVAFAGFYLII